MVETLPPPLFMKMLGKNLCSLCYIMSLLVVIGALNWGLVGLGYFFHGDWNVVHLILGSWPVVEYVVYVLVGIAALYQLFMYPKCCGKSNA